MALRPSCRRSVPTPPLVSPALQLDVISKSGGWWGRKVAVNGPVQPMRMAALC